MSADDHGPDRPDLAYPETFIAKLELLWGDGFLSPGGADEVAAVLAGFDLSGLDVLDIGCGTGGIDVALVETFGAKSVLGVDVEDPVLKHAEARAADAGLAEKIGFRLVEPGPLPMADASFDAVFSKDAMVHIPDKQALYADILRLLRPGGLFAASDWMRGDDGPLSERMQAWYATSSLKFKMRSPAYTEEALERAGFTQVRVVDRNPWYRQEGRRELARIKGPLRSRAISLLGEDGHAAWIARCEAMVAVLDSGEFRPVHIGARKGA